MPLPKVAARPKDGLVGTTKIRSRGSHDSMLSSAGPVIRRLLEMHGIDVADLARQAGVELARSPGPDERIDTDKVDALLRLAIPRIADPAFGLLAARCWHPGNLGVLGHAWLSSSTLRTSASRLVRYFRIVGERGHYETEDIPQGLKLRFWAGRGDPAADPVAGVAVDVGMSLLLDMCRLTAGAALRPRAVSLCRRRPVSALPYQHFFGCTIEFSSQENALVLSATDADRPLESSNRQLASVLDKMLTEQVARLDRSDVVARCKAAILEHLASGEISEDEAATLLHMSPRTLQRKLAEARTSYKSLVDGIRKDLALRYIEDPHRSMTDITFSLCFAGPSSLSRAFKRWTGVSPSEYRSAASARR
jgi:AraC-like DNA-binding protein